MASRFDIGRKPLPTTRAKAEPGTRSRRGRRSRRAVLPPLLGGLPSPAPPRFLDPPEAKVRRSELSPDILALPQPEWVANTLTVTGPEAELAAFRRAAEGPGFVPWSIDPDAIEERTVLLLMRPPPHERDISLQGARILARALRDVVVERHEAALAAVQRGAFRPCPLDLHKLVPVPLAVLALGADHPEAMAWLWANWGTTWTPRRIAVSKAAAEAFVVAFWSADWSPWPVLVTLRERWPALGFELKPNHG